MTTSSISSKTVLSFLIASTAIGLSLKPAASQAPTSGASATKTSVPSTTISKPVAPAAKNSPETTAQPAPLKGAAVHIADEAAKSMTNEQMLKASANVVAKYRVGWQMFCKSLPHRISLARVIRTSSRPLALELSG